MKNRTFFVVLIGLFEEKKTHQEIGSRTVARTDRIPTDTFPTSHARLTVPRWTLARPILPHPDSNPTGQKPDWTNTGRTFARLTDIRETLAERTITHIPFFSSYRHITWKRPSIVKSTRKSLLCFLPNIFLVIEKIILTQLSAYCPSGKCTSSDCPVGLMSGRGTVRLGKYPPG